MIIIIKNYLDQVNLRVFISLIYIYKIIFFIFLVILKNIQVIILKMMDLLIYLKNRLFCYLKMLLNNLMNRQNKKFNKNLTEIIKKLENKKG